jgi:O-antigen/teichoic acid export membrane protein
VRTSLVVALAAAVLSFAIFTTAAVRTGWTEEEWWRWAVLVLAAMGWGVVLVPWLRRWRHMTPRDHQHGMYRALFTWAFTDVAVLLAWAT